MALFGFRYDYDLRQLQRAEPIPAWLAEIVANVETFGGRATRIQQVLCTEYDVGSASAGTATSRISTRYSACRWDPPASFGSANAAGKTWDRFTLDAEPRSLYMMSGASRQIWEHSIPAVEAPRYSITFRTMTNGPDPRTPA